MNLRNSIIIATLLFVVYSLFKGRYRMLNKIIGNASVRRILVQVAMQMPFIRNQFLKQAFR
jgi:hypothetical protein